MRTVWIRIDEFEWVEDPYVILRERLAAELTDAEKAEFDQWGTVPEDVAVRLSFP